MRSLSDRPSSACGNKVGGVERNKAMKLYYHA